jgi:tetratricopeptide (TPR) repeat protein
MQPMARFGLLAILAATVMVTGPLPPARPQAAPDPDAAIDSALRVQKAMAQADAFLLANDPRRAVEALEAELPRINGNRKYLAKLRDAYRLYVPRLYADGQPAAAQKYLERLCILDPGANADPALQATAKTVRDARAVPTPPPQRPTLAEMAQVSGPPAAPAAVAVRPAVTVRAKVDDPFDAVNAAAPAAAAPDPKRQLAAKLLSEAETAFNDRRFSDALRYFEQAHREDQKATAGSQDRWAYCKLNHVVEQLNRATPDAGDWAALEGEIRSAMELAPRLADQGRWLQGELQGRRNKVEAVAVRHLGRDAQGWEVAETTNFRILHHQSRDCVEKAAQVAERTRAAMYRKWFGNGGEAWTPRCNLYLYATAQDYSRATGQSSGSPGHSRIESDSGTGRVVSRRMEMHFENPNLLDAVLPHETTHVVLAGQFGTHQVPRWADEGVAVLAEPADKVDLHRRNLARCQRDGQLLSLRELMQLSDYPQPRQIGAFYAQSVSLVDYLSRLKGAAVFTQFVRDGLREGYEPALRRHYGLRDFAELEERWGQQALAGIGEPATALAGR